MGLTNDLISQFVKSTKGTSKQTKDSTIYGTVITRDGVNYVMLDGSSILTPMTTTADVKDGERVIVSVKNHSAVVMGNTSSPAARVDTVKELDAKVAEFDTVVTENLEAANAKIGNLEAENATINNTLTAHKAEIDEINTEKLSADEADVKFATIENLKVTDAKIVQLSSDYGDFVILTANNFKAVDGYIEDLQANKISAKDIEGKYANIDFSNIGKAAMEYLYANSGLIQNIVIGDGTITGNLVGVTISGDLIQANTIKAEKLVIKGEDGIYYKLNTDGVKITSEGVDQNEYNSLNGSIIQAKSITAEQISVNDLVAFGATIGGFHITDESIYSGVKESVDNTTRGVYLDNDGQINFGDASDFIKYYKSEDGIYKLEISARQILLGSNGNSNNIGNVFDIIGSSNEKIERLEEQVENANDYTSQVESIAEDNVEQLELVRSSLKILEDHIENLVVDKDGSSLMTQTENGWVFSTEKIQNDVDDVSQGLNGLNSAVGSVEKTVSILEEDVGELNTLKDYVAIGTYEGEPCIELGETDTPFKLRITNTRILFMDGSETPAYITNNSLYIRKAVIENELDFGDFVWKIRDNGNLGLMWKGD